MAGSSTRAVGRALGPSREASLRLFGLPYSMVAGFKERVSHENKAESTGQFYDLAVAGI